MKITTLKLIALSLPVLAAGLLCSCGDDEVQKTDAPAAPAPAE